MYYILYIDINTRLDVMRHMLHLQETVFVFVFQEKCFCASVCGEMKRNGIIRVHL